MTRLKIILKAKILNKDFLCKSSMCQMWIIILFFSLFSYSQEQDQKVKLFYPLSIGDYWEYIEEPMPFYSIYRKVVGDTLMSNGKVYKIIQEAQDFVSVYPPSYWKNKFQRINDDSSEVYQYVHADSIPSEEKIFNLQVAVGDTWKYPKNSIGGFSSYFRVETIEKKIVLGRELIVVHIAPFIGGGLAEQDFFIADSLGIIFIGFEVGYYRLIGAIINGVKYGVTSVDIKRNNEGCMSEDIQLSIYPNPFNFGTEISYTVPKIQHVEISIYDILGRKIVTLIQGKIDKGTHKISWLGVDQEGRALPSGIYFCTILGEHFSDTAKLCILR